MSTLPPFARLLVQGALVLGWAVSAASGGLGADSPEPDVATLIRKLGDPSFQVRTEATRRLCMLGTPVRTQLEEAAKGSDIEIALRAKALLGIMDELLFSGCRLTLTASRSRVAWNEPLDLILTVQNTSTHPGTIPFERSAPDGRNADADQVAGLIDAADFLVVTGPDGMPVSFHLDTADPVPAVEALVRNRADAGPSSRLAPGRTRQHRMTAFNRGRARYPLLRAGTYRITVVYTPKWDDAEFTQTGVGARRSNTLELEVTNSPPAGIIGPNASPLITLNNVRGHVVAQLTNRRDLPVRINTNFSTGKPPFSALRWMAYFDKDWRDCPTSPAPDLPFSRDRLVEVRPGERLELGRVQLTELRRVAKLDASDTLFVRVLYTNLLDRRWQRQAKHPSAELSAPLPEHLLLTTLHSEPLRDDGNSSSGKAKVETP